MRPDAIVIGAGLSGLTSAVRLAEGGAKVTVLAKGSGAISLAPGTVDVIGYRRGRPVADAAKAASAMGAGHPYSLLGESTVPESLEWLRQAVARGPLAGYEYEGQAAENLLLPTALGAVKPSALAPASIAAGDVRRAPRALVVGIEGMKDFHPALIAANLIRSGFAMTTRAEVISRPTALALEPTTLNVARFLDDPENVEGLAERLAQLVRRDEAIALPAVLGLRRPAQTHALLQARLRRTVYEIPTLPPSIPGMRLLDVLKTLLRDAGGQFVNNAVVTGAERKGRSVERITVAISGRERAYSAPHYVLATGGVFGGAIVLGSDWITREAAFGLEVAHAPAPGEERFSDEYLGPHPMAKAGVAANSKLLPVDSGGKHALDNVRVVGATLGGAEPWREKSGDGISLATGYAAAQMILEELNVETRRRVAV